MDATLPPFAIPSASAALDEAGYLRALRFEKSAGHKLSRAAAKGDRPAFLKAVRKHLERAAFPALRKKRPAALSDLFADSTAAPCDNEFPRNGRSSNGAHRNGRLAAVAVSPPTSIGEWLARSSAVAAPEELLLLLELLVRDVTKITDTQLWQAWRQALEGVVALAAREPDSEASTFAARFRAQSELPWKAGLLLAGLDGSEALRRQGRDAIVAQLLENTGDDGLPNAEIMPQLDEWMAALVRAEQWSDHFGSRLWKGKSRDRFRKFARSAAALLTREGRLPFVNRSADLRPLVSDLLDAADWKVEARPRQTLFDDDAQRRERTASRAHHRRKPPAFQSDSAQVAILRSDWTPTADMLALGHAASPPRFFLAPQGRPVLEGDWELSVRVDGKPVALDGEWTCCCWHTDEDGDYAELQMTLDGDLGIERQVFLSRKDHFAVLVDCISGAGSRRVDSVSRLPLRAGITAQVDVPTREHRLEGRSAAVRVFPLALPQDRVQSTAGSLTVAGSHLDLAQSAIGGLTAPLVLDWSPRRRAQPADWRALTVTEQGQIVRSDTASGYRLRIGHQHLLLYRSFVKSGIPRAVLGHHTLSETTIGRFDAAGDVQPLLLVE